MARRRSMLFFLLILGLFLLGTVIVLSSITFYLAIDPSAYLSELEVPILDTHERWNFSAHGQVERVPRILHQTWRTENLPARWKAISQECRDLMPDYKYILWTDESSRDFIAEHYPWFLDTFNDYQYSIQRADAIRYFVLYHYGGIYFDLDIGCLRPLDPLLAYPVILPKTIPVGVSNDLMFAEKQHPFLAQTIHNLVTFDHSWILNYPTVMFSTGPMFLSAQYSIFTSSHASTPSDPIRILPKSLYGKNAQDGEAPHSFFSHFYGSSWHADDAAFIGFLGTWGKGLMWVGLIVLIIGVLRIMGPGKKRRYTLARIGAYEVLFPRWYHRTGRLHYHLPRSAMSSHSSDSSTAPPSPDVSTPSSPVDSDIPVFHLPFSLSSSATDRLSHESYAGQPPPSPLAVAFQHVRNRFSRLTTQEEPSPPTPVRPKRHRHSRGVLFFLPAIFTQSQDDVELGEQEPYSDIPMLSHPPAPRGRVMDPSSENRREPVDAAAVGQLIDLRDEPLSPSNNRGS